MKTLHTLDKHVWICRRLFYGQKTTTIQCLASRYCKLRMVYHRLIHHNYVKTWKIIPSILLMGYVFNIDYDTVRGYFLVSSIFKGYRLVTNHNNKGHFHAIVMWYHMGRSVKMFISRIFADSYSSKSSTHHKKADPKNWQSAGLCVICIIFDTGGPFSNAMSYSVTVYSFCCHYTHDRSVNVYKLQAHWCKHYCVNIKIQNRQYHKTWEWFSVAR